MNRRLLASNLSLALVVLLLLAVPLGVFFADRERKQLEGGVERDATVLGSLHEDVLEGTAALEPPRGATFGSASAQDYAERTGARVVIVDVNGISIVDTDNTEPRDFSTRPEIQEALGGNRSIGSRRSETLGTDLLFVAIPVASGGEVHGAVRLTLPTSAVDERVQRFWLSLLAAGAVVLGVAALLSYSMASTVVRPVVDLTDAADRLAAGDLSARIDTRDAPAELERLAVSFNAMAARIEELLASQRNFIADASHQLRTPLTALRLQLENAEAETTDDSTRADLVASINETDRLVDIVNQLLSLARSEGRRVEPAPLDVVATVADRVDLWQMTAEESGVELTREANGPLRAMGAPGSLEQILDNLLDNAISLTPAGGSVRVKTERVGDQAIVRVIDEGPGLSEDAKPRAFERFWRGDQVRLGTGLGLPIVRALAEQSGGTVAITDAPGGGLTVVITLAAADA